MRWFLIGCYIAVLFATTFAQDDTSNLSIHVDYNVCHLKPEMGPCEAAIKKWYFDRVTQQCKRFIYGGCKGNNNRFDSEAECLRRCKPVKNVCYLKPVTGFCKALFYRWYFNPVERECQQFVYGGCGGNQNNFKSRLDCQRACRKDCIYVRCFADPCQVTRCPAFPHATCVADYCNGCNADFFVNGRLVDCGAVEIEPPKCIKEGKKCGNPNHPDVETIQPFWKRCCPGTECCACGPPVLTQDYIPPENGTCQKRCFCPRG